MLDEPAVRTATAVTLGAGRVARKELTTLNVAPEQAPAQATYGVVADRRTSSHARR